MFHRLRRCPPLRAALFVLVLLGGTAGTARGDDDLYQDLGGRPGVGAVVEAFLFRLADDARINHHFAETNVVRFHDKLVELLCELTGGPCTYSGDSMKLTHAGMGIDHADFNAVVENLVEAMSGLGIATGVQNRLLARLAPLHADIIER